MNTETAKAAALGTAIDPADERDMRAHLALLGHDGLGVTELRVFDPRLQVAYADDGNITVQLCQEREGKASGIYVGVQPRPAHLFDLAPNRWVPAHGGPDGNCARDSDIEYITALFFDIDVVSPERAQGHPATPEELKRSLRTAEILSRQDGLTEHSSICCSGNGHYVLGPVIPISIDSGEVARKFRCFCQGLAKSVAGLITGARIDPVYNLSRVMRVIGTLNGKGQPSAGRPHRRAHFVTEPAPARSIALHYMILNTDIGQTATTGQDLPAGLRCRLDKIERCEFIQWCRRHPQEVSEPQWFGLISNLAHLQGGVERIHEISRLDAFRYDYAHTQQVIERMLREGYKPVGCRTIMSPAMARPGRGVFRCSRIASCPARAPNVLGDKPYCLHEIGGCCDAGQSFTSFSMTNGDWSATKCSRTRIPPSRGWPLTGRGIGPKMVAVECGTRPLNGTVLL